MGQAQSQDGRENSAREQQPCGENAAAEAMVPASKESDRAGQAPLPPGGLWEQGRAGWPQGEGSARRFPKRGALRGGGGLSTERDLQRHWGMKGSKQEKAHASGARQVGLVGTAENCRPVFCPDCRQCEGGRLLPELPLFQTKLEMWIFM